MQPGSQYGLPEMQEFMLAPAPTSAPHHFFSPPPPPPHNNNAAACRPPHAHFFHHAHPHHLQQQQQPQQHSHPHHPHLHHHSQQLQQQHQQQQPQHQPAHHATELLDLYRVNDSCGAPIHSLHGHSPAAELQRSATQSFFGMQQQHHHHPLQQQQQQQQQHMNVKPSLDASVVSALQLAGHQMQQHSHGGGSESPTDMVPMRARSALLSPQAQFKPLQMSSSTGPVGAAHIGAANRELQIIPAEAAMVGAGSAQGSGDELYGELGGELDDRSGGGGGGGSRWPREETLALLRIRSEMDALFRDSGLKAPLWEEVSRRLYLAGFQRNAKKCKEKFENLHKYYKKTKPERQDGKTYRFRTELEAIYAASQLESELECGMELQGPPAMSSAMVMGAMDHDAAAGGTASLFGPDLVAGSAAHESSGALAVHTLCGLAGPSSSASPSSSCGAEFQKLHGGEELEEEEEVELEEEEEEEEELEEEELEEEDGDDDRNAEGGGRSAGLGSRELLDGGSSMVRQLREGQQRSGAATRKRKRGGGGGGYSWRSMRLFFEDLARQLMERQDALHRQFLEAVERRDEERQKREETYKRQEMARMRREQELRAQEQALAGAREAALVSFLEKVTGETLQLPEMAPLPPPPPPPQAAAAPPAQHPANLYHHQHGGVASDMPNLMLQQMHSAAEMERNLQAAEKLADLAGAAAAFDGNTRRWPKVEVLALIRVRTSLEPRFQEAGPKAQLWEEVSSSMARLGYSRSSKRCKEKWENINKYFRKTKDSSGRKRGADSAGTSKTCPYFHQLEELYERGILSSPNSMGKLMNGAKLDGADQEQSEEPLESSKEDSGGGGQQTQSGMNLAHHLNDGHGSVNSVSKQINGCVAPGGATNTQLCMMNGGSHSAAAAAEQEQQGNMGYLDVKPLSEHPLINNVNSRPSGGGCAGILHLSLLQSEQEIPYQGGGNDDVSAGTGSAAAGAAMCGIDNNTSNAGSSDRGFVMRESMMDLEQQQKLVDEYERLDQQVQSMVQREQLEAAVQQQQQQAEMSRQMAAERSYRSDSASTLMALVQKLGAGGGSEFDLSSSPTACNNES